MSSHSLHPLSTRAAMTMVLADPGTDPAALPLPGMVELLSQTIQSELNDQTWVLHVVWDVALPPPTTPPTQIRVPMGVPNLSVFVHDQLQRFCDDWGIAFDEVLIETSGVNPDGSRDAELWWAMHGLTCTSSVDYLVDDPEQWDQLPATLGLLPATVNVQAIALLGPMPEAHLVQTLLFELLSILGSSDPASEAKLWFQDAIFTQRFARWRRRWLVVVSQIYSSTRFKPKPWPLDAIRLRFEGDPSVVTPAVRANVDSFGRWARGVTDRRVGVAIGGAGAQSYVGIPFVEQLRDAGVPIDVLAGSSTGAFVGVFYAALGDKGLRRLLLNSNTLGWGVFFALVNNIPLTWWLAWATNFVDFNDLAQPTISVSSVAQTGEPYHQTSGLAGKGMMASGSLPPFVATYIGNTRLLDGGVTQDLPTAILNAAGAELVIAAQPVPKVPSRQRLPDQIPVPYFMKWAATLNPLLRGFDSYRGYLMLIRQAAMSAEPHAEVLYNATTKSSGAGSWYAGPRIAAEAADSPALKNAIIEAKLSWQALLADAPGRARINRGTNQVEVGPAVRLGFELDPSAIWRLTPHAEQLLLDIGRYVANFASALNITLVNIPAPDIVDYEPLFEAATGLPSAQLNYNPVLIPGAPPTLSLGIVP